MKILTVLILLLLSFQTTAFARTTPEDILNAQRDAYNKKIQTYSPSGKQKLENLSGEISRLNKNITNELGQNMERQGQILEEYIRRNNLEEISNDGIKRNLNEPVENGRYWLTFAHEAVAYQAAKVYVFNLTNEQNIKNDVNATVALFQSDINGLSAKVSKSQQIIQKLIIGSKNK